jgi:hypothetical protein
MRFARLPHEPEFLEAFRAREQVRAEFAARKPARTSKRLQRFARRAAGPRRISKVRREVRSGRFDYFVGSLDLCSPLAIIALI